MKASRLRLIGFQPLCLIPSRFRSAKERQRASKAKLSRTIKTIKKTVGAGLPARESDARCREEPLLPSLNMCTIGLLGGVVVTALNPPDHSLRHITSCSASLRALDFGAADPGDI